MQRVRESGEDAGDERRHKQDDRDEGDYVLKSLAATPLLVAELDLPVGFANSCGLVFVDESAEELAAA